jgi:hypothetical protein
MLGPEGVSRALINRLVAKYPSVIADFRERYNASADDIPTVMRVYPAERDVLSIESFPAVFVTESETTGKLDTRQIEADGESDTYTFRYRKRIFIFCAGDATDPLDLLRKRLILATREILLTDKILYNTGGQYAVVDGNTVRESFSDIVANQSNQFLSGAYLELDVVTEELLAAYPPPSEHGTDFVVPVGNLDPA